MELTLSVEMPFDETEKNILSFPATQLLGISVKELISSSDVQARGMKAISEKCNVGASLNMMDLSVEAEAFGAKIRFSEDEIPTVEKGIIDSISKAEQVVVPSVGSGRTGLYIEGVKKAKEAIKDIPVFCGVIGPYSLAGRLFDMTELMMECYDSPDEVKVLLAKATEFIIEYIKAFKRVGADGVIMAEPAAGLLSPALAEEFSMPFVQRIFNEINNDDFIVCYHNCGNAAGDMLDMIAELNADIIHLGNAINIKKALEELPKDKVVMGNVDPVLFRTGTPETITADVQRVFDECSMHENFMISTGCDVPAASKWENIDAYFEKVNGFMHRVVINGETQYAKDGTLLSDLLAKSGKSVDHPCGGRGMCRKCVVTVNGREELSCRYEVKSDISVLLPDSGEIFSETGALETRRITDSLCYALDIGTTTLALALVSLEENKVIRAITRTNPQRAFGADVMTRIDYCRKNGVDALQKAVISEINSMISAFETHEIEKCYVSGNATMLYLLYGIDCSSMGVAPYTPQFLESKTKNAKDIGITGVATVVSLPSIAAFVGADIVAGLNYIGMPEKGKHNLLVDLGTNAEIVLYSEESALCTAAAAGPCFEGANISCGMSATNGAIYAYSKNEIKTVGNVPPKGICGTGLVDLVAEFLSDETIDETGFMEVERFEVAEGVSVTQADIRQYQLAKSAVHSAIQTLLQMKNVSFAEIDKMYISGGFSAKINIGNAAKTGLLPKELAGKSISVNNSSLLGTVKYACENNDLAVYMDHASYVDLSATFCFRICLWKI